jgi:hypothetical protein
MHAVVKFQALCLLPANIVKIQRFTVKFILIFKTIEKVKKKKTKTKKQG